MTDFDFWVSNEPKRVNGRRISFGNNEFYKFRAGISSSKGTEGGEGPVSRRTIIEDKTFTRK